MLGRIAVDEWNCLECLRYAQSELMHRTKTNYKFTLPPLIRIVPKYLLMELGRTSRSAVNYACRTTIKIEPSVYACRCHCRYKYPCPKRNKYANAREGSLQRNSSIASFLPNFAVCYQHWWPLNFERRSKPPPSVHDNFFQPLPCQRWQTISFLIGIWTWISSGSFFVVPTKLTALTNRNHLFCTGF